MEPEALKFSNLVNEVTNIMCRNSSFVAILKFLMNFSAELQKERIVFCLAALMVDIVENIVSPDFLSGNSPQTYQCNIRMVKFFLQYPKILNIIRNIDGKKKRSRNLGISQLDNGTFF